MDQMSTNRPIVIQYRPVGKGTPPQTGRPGYKHVFLPWCIHTLPVEMIKCVACKSVWHGGSPLRDVNTLG